MFSKRNRLRSREADALVVSVSCQGLKLWFDKIYHNIAKSVVYAKGGGVTEL